MKILRIYPFLPPLPGGMEKHILRLTEEQRKMGHDITLAFNQGNLTEPADIQILTKYNLRRIRPQALRDLIFYFILAIVLLRQGKHYDIVHVHGDWSAFLFARLVTWIVGAKKSVASMHGSVRNGIMACLYRVSLSMYDTVYVTGAQGADYLRSLLKRPVYWQHSGIDPVFIEHESAAHRTIDVILVGSLVPVKNIDLVLDIASLLPDCRFLMVGDGPLRQWIEFSCQRRKIHNVTLAGHKMVTEVAAFMHQARIFLSTSFVEGTPTALLEAMACGLVIVTSNSNDYGGIIKSDKNGFVINGYHAPDYARQISGILDNEALRVEMSQHNRDQAADYCWPIVARRITEWMC